MQSLIRPFIAADYASCLDIFNSNVPQFFTSGEAVEYTNWLTQLSQSDNSRDGEGEIHYFVATQDGRVLGCGGWGIRDGADHATLVWGAVHRDFHKQGIGKQLTAFRVRHFRNVYPELKMTIDTSHLTAPFYERFGFRTVQFTENGYAPGLHRHDMVMESW